MTAATTQGAERPAEHRGPDDARATSARTPRAFMDRALLWIEVLAGVGVVAAVIGKAYGPASTVVFVCAALATAFTAWAIVRAIGSWGDESLDLVGRVRDLEREQLEHEKLLLLQGIKELEADTAVGKVDARDYEYLRRTAEERAIAIIERLRNDDAHWMSEAEALVRTRLGAGAAPTSATSPTSATNATSAMGTTAATAAAPGGAKSPEMAARSTSGAERVAAPPATGATPGAAIYDDRPVLLRIVDGHVACSACGATSDSDARFCTGCGRPRAGGDQ